MNMLIKYLFLIFFLFFFSALIIGYSVDFFSGVKFDREGFLLFEQRPEPGLPAIIPNLVQDYLGWQNFSKRDFFFFAYYKLDLNLKNEFREIPNLRFSFSLPGEILNHNADRIEGKVAIWENIPKEGKIFLETRQIRYWLIILTFILIFFGIARFRKGQK